MVEPLLRCAACGYPVATDACARCGGSIHDSGDGHRITPRRGTWLGDAIHGFWTFFAAAAHLFNRKEYFGRLAGPIVANLAVLGVALAGFFWLPYELLQSWWSDAGRIGAWLTVAGAALVAAFVLFAVAPVLIELVTAPFLDPLVRATEEAWAGGPMPAVDENPWRGALAGARSSAQILMLQLLLLVPVVLLSLTGVGAILGFLLTAWLNALVWFDIPGARRGYGLRERSRLLRRNLARALGFGAAAQIGLVIPVFNLVLWAPTAAIGASILYFHFDKAAAARPPRVPALPPSGP